MEWTPPTEAEFNDWFQIEDILEHDRDDSFGYSERRSLIERLKAGLVIAVARNAQPHPDIQLLTQYEMVPAYLFRTWDDEGDYHFWNTSEAIFVKVESGSTGYDKTEKTYRFFDVRFDPKSFGSNPPALPANLIDGPQSKLPSREPSDTTLQEISNDGIARLAKAVAAGWADKLTDDKAWKFAKELQPQYKIAKHRFLDQYRINRGDKKPGKKLNIGN